MPEVIIKYHKPETLKVLKSLGKYLGFDVASKKGAFTSKKSSVTIVPGDGKIDIDELSALFTSKNINAAELRKSAWKRNV